MSLVRATCLSSPTNPSPPRATALQLIRDHKNIESVLEHLDDEASKAKEVKASKKAKLEGWKPPSNVAAAVPQPEPLPTIINFDKIRRRFSDPKVCLADDFELTWEAPDVKGLTEFFKDKRIAYAKRIKRLQNAAWKAAKGEEHREDEERRRKREEKDRKIVKRAAELPNVFDP